MRRKTKIRTKATSHSFRKSSATHMLRNGARMENVQHLLGHSDIASTEPYTKVYPKDLVKMHRVHHPREKQKNIILPELKVPYRLGKSHISYLSRPDIFGMLKKYHPREKDQIPPLSKLSSLI